MPATVGWEPPSRFGKVWPFSASLGSAIAIFRPTDSVFQGSARFFAMARTASTHPQRVSAVSEFETVGKVEEFEEGRGKAVPVDDRMVAVFRRGGQWYAIDDLCPHMGASLAEGHVEGETVTCPWHAWRFCIKDGTWEDNRRVKVDTFEVRVVGDEVQVRERPPESVEPGEGTGD